MTDEKPRVRFAPSPSGSLHVGNVRTALFNWLFARRYGGDFILRIEDTDQERVSDIHTQNLLAELIWLGLDWDEGPIKGGAAGPYQQSQRLSFYHDYLEILKKDNRVYLCYCTEKELEAERKSLTEKRLTPRYSGKCRGLSAQQKLSLEQEGRTPAYRFHVGEGTLEFVDLIRGAMKFDCRSLGDFIVIRSNGIPAYNFAVVTDDHLMGITHVIRGEDHLSNTAAQLLIYRALGFSPPHFAHHALILGKDHAKLSKRHGAVSVGEFKNQGFLPEALINYLSLVGSTIIEAGEIQSLGVSVKNFSLAKLGRAGAIFDEAKLRWLNEAYIRREEPAALLEKLQPFIKAAGYDQSGPDREKLLKIVTLTKDNITILADISPWLDIFLAPLPPLDSQGEKFLKEDSARQVLISFRETLIRAREDGALIYSEVIDQVRAATGCSGGKLLLPIRVALTGRTRGPELAGIFGLLGKEKMLTRVRAVLNS